MPNSKTVVRALLFLQSWIILHSYVHSFFSVVINIAFSFCNLNYYFKVDEWISNLVAIFMTVIFFSIKKTLFNKNTIFWKLRCWIIFKNLLSLMWTTACISLQAVSKHCGKVYTMDNLNTAHSKTQQIRRVQKSLNFSLFAR